MEKGEDPPEAKALHDNYKIEMAFFSGKHRIYDKEESQQLAPLITNLVPRLIRLLIESEMK